MERHSLRGYDIHMWQTIEGIIAAALVVAFFYWFIRTSGSASTSDAVIDPSDARQIGTLVGLMGGSIADAAVAQFALRRFEEEQGRKATVRDMGTVVAMMRAGR